MSQASDFPDQLDQERLSRLQLVLSENIGPATYHHLLAAFDTAKAAVDALPDMATRSSAGKRIKLCSLERALQIAHRTRDCGGRIIFHGDAAYPFLLSQTVNPPPILFAVGRTEFLQQAACAVVGSRNASANGKRFAREVAAGLGQSGWKIISGLARGIDTAAHEASVLNGTIAVTATGIDVVYPPENTELHARIGCEGCVVTEMPPGTKPRADLFPRRNRIIAGLAAGVVVVEAATRSGSLITANLANDMGRDVFAVPGSPLDPRSAGTNRLIQQGAMLITSHQDVINNLDPERLYDSLPQVSPTPVPPAGRSQAPFSRPGQNVPGADAGDTSVVDDAHRRAVLDLLGPDPVDIDVVVREAGFSARTVQMVLVELDLSGQLERHSGHRVSRID